MSQRDQEPPDKRPTFMDYLETFKHEEWKASRLCAEEIMKDIQGLKEEFDLDQITLGDGQCFMTSIIQQLRRPDVNSCLMPRLRQHVKFMDPRAFKIHVRTFMQRCQHQKVKELKVNWKSFTGLSSNAKDVNSSLIKAIFKLILPFSFRFKTFIRYHIIII